MGQNINKKNGQHSASFMMFALRQVALVALYSLICKLLLTINDLSMR